MSESQETLTVRMSADFLSRLSSKADDQGFNSRSEFVRYLLRNGLEDSDPLSAEHATALKTSRSQLKRDETIPTDEVFAALEETESEAEYRDQLGLNDEPQRSIPDQQPEIIDYDTSVVACGGGGISVLQHSLNAGLSAANTFAYDTDQQAVRESNAEAAVRIGSSDLDADPIKNFDFQADNEKLQTFHDAIRETIGSADTVIVLSGIGGQTGTYVAPHIAHVAAEQGSTVVGVGTLPFKVETKRIQRAEDGLEPFAEETDTLLLLDGAEITRDDRGHAFTPAIKQMNTQLGQLVQRMCTANSSYQVGEEEVEIDQLLADRGVGFLVYGSASAEELDPAEIREKIESQYVTRPADLSDAEFCLLNVTAGEDVSEQVVGELLSELSRTEGEFAYSQLSEGVDDRIEWTGFITGFGFDPADILDTQATVFDYEVVEATGGTNQLSNDLRRLIDDLSREDSGVIHNQSEFLNEAD